MGVNDELTPREHDDLRRTLLEGARRIKPVGAHRMQLIAVSVALVLVAGVAGGAWATASLLGRGPVPAVTSPSPTPTSTPTPTPTPTSAPTSTPTPDPGAIPSEGVLPFGGACSNALTLERVGAAIGMESQLVEPAYRSGAEGLQGGIFCLWTNVQGEAPRVTLIAYPAGGLPEDVANLPTSCSDTSGCQISGFSGDTWLWMSTSSPISETSARELWDSAATNATQYAAPQPAPRTPQWWPAVSCPDVSQWSGLPEAASGGADESAPAPELWSSPYALPSRLGDVVSCLLRSGSSPADPAYIIELIPGGAAYFDAIAASDGAQAVFVDGAVSAVAVPDQYVFEGYHPPVIASDGVNLVIVSQRDPSLGSDDRATVAAHVLAGMSNALIG